VALFAFISLATALPTGLISNVLQAQTQVVPAQPVTIGGGAGGNPKSTSTFLAPASCVAGSPFNITLTASNPNNYTVMGTLYMNFSISTPSPISASAIIVSSANPAMELYVVGSASPATNSTLFHIYPVSASDKFLILPGATKDLVDLTVDFSTAGNYTWTIWIGT
jgi:hypothetical protein